MSDDVLRVCGWFIADECYSLGLSPFLRDRLKERLREEEAKTS